MTSLKHQPRSIATAASLAVLCVALTGAAERPTPKAETSSAPAAAERGPITLDAAAAASAPTAVTRSAGGTPPLPGPKYLLLRYDEDFAYLDRQPDERQADFFDPVKRIRLDDDWLLRFGGEARVRMESETNRNFGARDPSNDVFLLHRYLLHFDLSYRRTFRLFAEAIDARVEDRDLPQIPGMENTFDIHQLFTDLRLTGDDSPLTLRIGRQELLYGRERLIGKLDWMNQGRRFDGAKLMYHTPQWDLDIFWTKPVAFTNQPFTNPFNTHINESLNRHLDVWREEQNFYGAYSIFKGIPNHVWDLYFIGLNDSGIFTNANNRFGDLDVYTIGSRFAGASGAFDYDIEGAGQWGQWVGDEVHAWMFGGDAGYTFRDVRTTPRIGVGFDYATGDDTPRDNAHETFNQLYPTGHAFLGYADLVARENVISPNLNFSFKPVKDISVKLTWYHFWLDSSLDALYNAGAIPIRRNISGSSGNDVGDELDATINWQVDAHSAVLIGWSHFWPSNFIETSGQSRDADYVYLQYQFRF